MTKSEFVDHVAQRANLSKKEAGDAVDAVIATIEDTLSRGSEVNFTGFGKFHVADRGARQGVHPQTKQPHPDPGVQGSPLHRRLRPQERGQGQLTTGAPGSRPARPARDRRSRASPTGWPPPWKGGGRRSSSGSIPIPPRLWPAARSRPRATPGTPAERAARRGRGAVRGCSSRRPVRRAWPSSRRSPSSSAWARPDGRRSRATVRRAHDAGLLVIADAKRGDVPARGRRLRARRWWETATPFGDVAGPGRRRAHRQSAAWAPRCSRRCSTRAPRRRAVRARAHVQPGRRRRARTPSSPAAARCGSASPRSWTRLGAARTGASGLADVGAVAGATAPEHLARMRELMPRAVLLLPGVGAQGGRVEDLGAAFAPGPGGRPGHRLAQHRRRARGVGRPPARGGARARPSACARRPGRWPESGRRPAVAGNAFPIITARDAPPQLRAVPCALPGAARARGLRRRLPGRGRQLGRRTERRDPRPDRHRAASNARRGPQTTTTVRTARSPVAPTWSTPGDNLSTIAERRGCRSPRLRELNPTVDPQGLSPGQRLKLAREAALWRARRRRRARRSRSRGRRSARAGRPPGRRSPAVTAPAALVIETTTGQAVFSRNPDQPRPMASTTKLMTVLLTLERALARRRPDRAALPRGPGRVEDRPARRASA